MNKFLEVYRYYAQKRYSTIAGTLVYFLLMSITPLILWVTMVFGKIEITRILSLPILRGASSFVRSLQTQAEGAASGAGIILLITSLYSSTNFFYHLRRSGEIIYDCKTQHAGGIKLRIVSFAYIFLLVLCATLLGGFMVGGDYILSKFISQQARGCVLVVLICSVVFFIALIMNIFACPYKIGIKEVLSGSLLTTALWIFVAVGFNLYLIFALPSQLYGKIAVLFVFLLWCYLMMCCFVIGAIHNGKILYKKSLVVKTYNQT